MGAACGRISEAETPIGATELREHSDDDSEDDGDLVIARRLAAAPVTPRQVPGVSTLPLSAGSTWSGGASSSGATVSNTGDGTAPRADAANGAAPPLTDGLGRVSSRGGAALGSTTPSHALRWQRGELLGTGAFGRVFLGLNEDTGELLAVKEVLLSGTTMERAAEQLKSLEAEVALMLELSHPNIVRYLGTERTPQARPHVLTTTLSCERERPATWLVEQSVAPSCWLRVSNQEPQRRVAHAPPVQPQKCADLSLDDVPYSPHRRSTSCSNTFLVAASLRSYHALVPLRRSWWRCIRGRF